MRSWNKFIKRRLRFTEVTLVAILDDKEGFLRSESALIQTSGRAARHIDGKVIMYAANNQVDNEYLREMYKRREVQKKYNSLNNISPKAINKLFKKA